jgi:hypothetical protein
MTMKSLAEAAAEVLNRSRHDSAKEPMHKLGNTGSGLENVVDLGGATYENPEGGNMGEKAAAARGVAKPPGVQPDADKKAPMEKLESGDGGDPENKRPNSKEAASTSNQKAGELESPEDHNGPHADRGTRNKVGYAQPTNVGEETEVDDEYQIEDDEELEEVVTEEEIAEAKAERMENAKKKMKAMSCKEDIDAMFSNETLSEEFKTKATTIFEAAVLARAVAIAEQLEEEILDAAQEALDDSRVEIEEQVDTYLNFVVENWVQENQVAIESGLRSEIYEDFIQGLKNLFAENYIDVPAEKVDVIEAQAEEIAELQDKVNETLNANAELTKKLSESTKQSILTSACDGLTATQAEKLKTLAEGVEFTTDGEYAKKLKTIRESYFNSSGKTVKQDNNTSVIQLTESESPAHVEEEISSTMSAYVNVLSRTQSN